MHHLSRVMRIRVGEEMELVLRDSWNVYRVVVESLTDDTLTAKVEEEMLLPRRPYMLSLVFGLSKGGKNDSIVRQAVEIGADRLMPALFERTVTKLDEKKASARRARLQSIAQSAAQQSHRISVPEVYMPGTLTDLEDEFSEVDHLFVLWEESEPIPLSKAIEEHVSGSDGNVMFVIGPEGGISSDEIEYLKRFGAIVCSLGATILRVDTANAVALGVAVDTLTRIELRNEGNRS